MSESRIPYALLPVSGVMLIIAAFNGGTLPFGFVLFSASLFIFSFIFLVREEIRIHKQIASEADALQNKLIESFNEILRENSADIGLADTLGILENESPEEVRFKGIFAQLEFTRGLFNRQLNLFRAKNKTIKDLNDRILFSKQQLEAVFDAQAEAICMLDSNLKIFRLNKAYSVLCGKPLKQLIGEESSRMVPVNGIDLIKRAAQQVFETGQSSAPIQLETTAESNRRFFTYRAFPIFEGENVAFVLEHYRNITEEKRMNEQLIRSANLASIGTMIAGIAHEMNNPLSGISGTAANMVSMPDTYGLNPKGKERLQDILESASRAENILKGLLDLSRKKEAQFVIMNIVPAIEKAAQSIHINGYGHIRRTIFIEPGFSPVVNCDSSRVTQVFINLISNASLSVLELENRERLAGREGYQPEIRISIRKRGNYVGVSVTDNGLGIDPDKLGQVFDPFFSTRPTGQGTGLGLSICQKIMMEHNGRLVIDKHDRGETCFTAEFPSASAN
ncbi:MAG: PAS domain-containing protein [Fibrobacteres bacterium]|nr:PAS domain-containing protein [Fibrobacterota bacterium]